MARTRKQGGMTRRLPSGRYQALVWTANGMRSTGATYDDENTAEKALRAAAVDVDRGTFASTPKTVPMFHEFALEYIERRRPSMASRTVQNWESYLRTTLRSFALVRLDKLDVRLVERWWAEHEDQPVSRRNSFFFLRPVLNAAVRYGIIPANPCLLIEVGAKPGKDVSIARPAWTEDDFRDVLRYVPEEVSLGRGTVQVPVHYREALWVAFGSHARIEELVGLNASDWTDPLLHITKQGANGANTKTGVARHIPLLDPASDVLRAYLRANARIGNAPLFTGARGGRLGSSVLRAAWDDAVLASGRTNMHVHDIRSIGLTICAESGLGIRDIMTRAGHRSERAALRYIRSTENRVLDAVALVNAARAVRGA